MVVKDEREWGTRPWILPLYVFLMQGFDSYCIISVYVILINPLVI